MEEAKAIPDSIDHMDKLALYGLFKTATVGKCNIGRFLLTPHSCMQLDVQYSIIKLHKSIL